MSEYKVIKNYRNDDVLRGSFNELAKNTFGIDFEDWYQNGYWTDNYNPYSIVLDGKVVANVSVNRTDFEWNGEIKHFIQLGTVMTDEDYRNRGLIRKIMEEIDADYEGKVDGVYLFANNEVLNFYPKFGFTTIKQYEYVKEVQNTLDATAEKVDMSSKDHWDRLQELIENSYHQSTFEMVDNSGLNMFYVSKFMQDCVYYCADSDVYVIAEIEDGEMILNMVISKKEVDMNKVIEAFGREISSVVLGFTPKDTTGFTVREMDQDDSTMHVKGIGWQGFEEDALMVPLLAHA